MISKRSLLIAAGIAWLVGLGFLLATANSENPSASEQTARD